MKAGAIDFLVKPFERQRLLEGVRVALEKDSKSSGDLTRVLRLKERFDKLTKREKQVFAHISAGEMNKEIASMLGISVATVKVHRAKLMKKLDVNSAAELGRIAECLKASIG